jgi:hypothetical protein
MLDMLDFAIVTDEYMKVNKTNLPRGRIYVCVWSMLVPGSIIPNAPIKELNKISLFLKERGYYVRAGKKPRYFTAISTSAD